MQVTEKYEIHAYPDLESELMLYIRFFGQKNCI